MLMPESESIKAYDLVTRVATYDADMELMHPKRRKMVEVALQILPFDAEASFTALELGGGTGSFSHSVLNRFPNCRSLRSMGPPPWLKWPRSDWAPNQAGGFSHWRLPPAKPTANCRGARPAGLLIVCASPFDTRGKAARRKRCAEFSQARRMVPKCRFDRGG